MGPFWAGLAAYHFLPLYRGREGTLNNRRRVDLSPLRPLLLEVALPVRRRRVF